MEGGSGPLPKAPQRDGSEIIIPCLDNVAPTARNDRQGTAWKGVFQTGARFARRRPQRLCGSRSIDIELGPQTPWGNDVGYELDEHRHRFSVWAAARATQRGLCDVVTLREALENCGVVAFVRGTDLNSVGASEFAKYHREWCRLSSLLRRVEKHRWQAGPMSLREYIDCVGRDGCCSFGGQEEQQ